MERNVVYYSCCESFDHCLCFFFFITNPYIAFFFLGSLVQTFYKPTKNIVHCLNSTQLAGEAPYPDVTYHLTLRRRPLFYGFHFFPHSNSMGSCCLLEKRSCLVMIPIRRLSFQHDNCKYFKIYSMQTNMMTMITKLPQFST